MFNRLSENLGMRGEMNDRRKRLIRLAYASLDKDGSVSTYTTKLSYMFCILFLFNLYFFVYCFFILLPIKEKIKSILTVPGK